IRLSLDKVGGLKIKGKKDQLDGEIIGQLKANKAEIMAFLQQSQQAQPKKRPAITVLNRADADGLFEPSYAQQRLWFIDRMDGPSVNYNISQTLKVNGPFDITRAEQAFGQIVERHEPLRTVFVEHDGSCRQLVRDFEHFKITSIDADSANPFDLPFDLSDDLMLRVGFENGLLQVNMHHIAADGLSMGVLVKEFIHFYQGGQKLEELPVQYADYAHWQRHWLTGDVLKEQLDYWKKQLDGLPPVHSLQLVNPRPERPTYNGAIHRFTLDETTSNALKTLASSHQSTLFMVLHGALALLLSRYSNTRDIVIGTAVANRLQKELEGLIGFFVNTLVLRTECSLGQSFTQFLKQIKTVNVDAQSHQDVPFETLVEHLNPDRNTRHSPLFQIMMTLDQSSDSGAIELADGVTLSDFLDAKEAKSDVVAKFELSFNFGDGLSSLSCSIIYNTDLYQSDSIKGMGEA
ncbi:MAG: condensation domain-containing protein, partial [Psychrosphaera sp.]|nr:condensation domain-containing protein [Psychrosphaera sp.]